jgi:hypothetical protein
VAAVLAAARTDVATANSYDYRTLGRDLTAALAVTTGSYRQQLRQAFTTVVEPQARLRHAAQDVHVGAVGIETLPSDARSAAVLVAATLHVRSRSVNHVDPLQAEVTLTLVGGRWLLSRVTTPSNSASDASAQAPGSPQLRAAQAAGDRETAAIGTFSHATFAHHLHRAVAGTTGAFRADLLHNVATLRRQARAADFRLVTHVPFSAVVTASGNQVAMLVTLDTVRGHGSQAVSTTTSDLVTVTDVKGHWLISAANTVSGS